MTLYIYGILSVCLVSLAVSTVVPLKLEPVDLFADSKDVGISPVSISSASLSLSRSSAFRRVVLGSSSECSSVSSSVCGVSAMLEFELENDEMDQGILPKFGELLDTGATSTVYSYGEGLVVKVQRRVSGESVHPLVREAFFLSRLHGSGLVPDSVRLTRAKGESRSLVMSYAGRSLKMCFPMKAKRAIRIAIQAIEVVRHMHEIYLIGHGDVHPGNVVVNDAGEVRLIDLGRAYYLAAPSPVTCGTCTHQTFSPWENKGSPSGARDDVYRLIMLLSYLLCGSAQRMFACLEAKNPALFEQLTDAKVLALSVSTRAGIPPYAEIIEHLELATRV